MLRRIVDMAHAMKRAGRRVPADMRPADIDEKVLVMIFEKPSTRTRVSFDIGMRQLGGQTIALNHADLQTGRGEPIADTARVLSRYGDVIMLRTNSHESLLEYAAHATIPVINGLTDVSHPCQVIADVMTFEEAQGPIAGRTVAWVGDGNNVAASWMHAAVRFGFKLRLGCPPQLNPDKRLFDWVRKNGGDVVKTQHAAVPDGSGTVGEMLQNLVATIGENMTLRRATALTVSDGVVASYIHNSTADGMGKIGVLVALESTGDKSRLTDIGRKVAMHVASAKPLAATTAELDPAVVEKERAILTEQAAESGKPANVIEKMVEGRIRKFYQESVLVEQAFVMDPDVTVGKFIETAGKNMGADVKLKGFVRYEVGEGIEKVVSDFAAEVASMQKN